MQRRSCSSPPNDNLRARQDVPLPVRAMPPSPKSKGKAYRALSVAVWHSKVGPFPVPILFLLALAAMCACLATTAGKPEASFAAAGTPPSSLRGRGRGEAAMRGAALREVDKMRYLDEDLARNEAWRQQRQQTEPPQPPPAPPPSPSPPPAPQPPQVQAPPPSTSLESAASAMSPAGGSAAADQSATLKPELGRDAIAADPAAGSGPVDDAIVSLADSVASSTSGDGAASGATDAGGIAAFDTAALSADAADSSTTLAWADTDGIDAGTADFDAAALASGAEESSTTIAGSVADSAEASAAAFDEALLGHTENSTALGGNAIANSTFGSAVVDGIPAPLSVLAAAGKNASDFGPAAAAVPALPPGADVPLVRGAPTAFQQRYQAFKLAGNFQCFDGSATFASFDQVNDDFCDCLDGSDEPGTGACSHVAKASASVAAKFACAWNSTANLSETDPRLGLFRLSAVNDGICDCCGGEDEWNSEVVCQDTCEQAAAEESLHEKQRSEGSKAREAYVQQAVSLKDNEALKDIDGGPDNVWLAAAAAPCINFDDGDYKYEVCLFSKVVQKSSKNDESVKLGGKGKWATSLWENGEQRKDYSKLIMGDGDHCAAVHAPRRAEVLFECSMQPEVLSVQETQVCVYTVHMKTPAACHPLVHK